MVTGEINSDIFKSYLSDIGTPFVVKRKAEVSIEDDAGSPQLIVFYEGDESILGASGPTMPLWYADDLAEFDNRPIAARIGKNIYIFFDVDELCTLMGETPSRYILDRIRPLLESFQPIRGSISKIYNMALNNANSRISSVEENIVNLLRRIEMEKESLIVLKKKADSLADFDEEKEKRFLESLTEDAYDSIHIEDNGVVTAITKPLTLYGNGTSRNLGSFRVEYNAPNRTIRVYGDRNNLEAGDFYHPHVDDEGVVCFGNGLPMADKMMVEYDLFGLLTLVYDVLANFNSHNPYRQLEDFN